MTSDTKSEWGHLRKAIRDLHGVNCTHVRSEPVAETFQGTTVWDGVVEVFACAGSEPRLVYAWESETEDGGRQVVTVVGNPLICSASAAVRAAIAAARRSEEPGS
jgi:hypothetical protein